LKRCSSGSNTRKRLPLRNVFTSYDVYFAWRFLFSFQRAKTLLHLVAPATQVLSYHTKRSQSRTFFRKRYRQTLQPDLSWRVNKYVTTALGRNFIIPHILGQFNNQLLVVFLYRCCGETVFLSLPFLRHESNSTMVCETCQRSYTRSFLRCKHFLTSSVNSKRQTPLFLSRNVALSNQYLTISLQKGILIPWSVASF
jgi:hypothetical protein